EPEPGAPGAEMRPDPELRQREDLEGVSEPTGSEHAAARGLSERRRRERAGDRVLRRHEHQPEAEAAAEVEAPHRHAVADAERAEGPRELLRVAEVVLGAGVGPGQDRGRDVELDLLR